MDELVRKLKARHAEGKLVRHCHTVVAHEDSQTQDLAKRACDQLERELGRDLSFPVRWWRFAQLNDPEKVHAAAAEAAEADLILLCFPAGSKLPRGVEAWIESSLRLRQKPSGAIAVLMGTGGPERNPSGPAHEFLQNLTRSRGVDYWAFVPGEHPGTIPESLDNFIQRANESSPVLDEILTHDVPPR